ncbi:hypothetical protein PoB_006654500 [Plakobranchus ocellatus]|uniref:Uncharacterized protein n=1 Tax=Plakobranchus ocellatus TaxID=259542 RepID=A0AAV4D7L6_9GAST|nr:hypothetical protein PoB_006654500 [Plakobranchus ocellatus]
MVASEAKYHLKCVATFSRRKSKLAHKQREEEDALTLLAIAFAELFAYIESFRHDPEKAPVFSKCNHCRLYGNRLKGLGFQFPRRVHSRRLQEKKKTPGSRATYLVFSSSD